MNCLNIAGKVFYQKYFDIITSFNDVHFPSFFRFIGKRSKLNITEYCINKKKIPPKKSKSSLSNEKLVFKIKDPRFIISGVIEVELDFDYIIKKLFKHRLGGLGLKCGVKYYFPPISSSGVTKLLILIRI